ncbi:hypothetical protein [Planomonospora parontospora]|uniref:hypothetical protein n=1 Tax=Planomonospora parontospora TaxID=58119 RepID=UPI00166F7791|nr:hypothetical protein [Planomonospora parontospora]GGL27129.1 hypothetical protein GCM10014719_30840 [Planomonospora parontospora subsp. antibiotica]GII16559.1 hypothetical protein Ppa05_32850 [Planomonospora parontospora subsp. antibiotica]
MRDQGRTADVYHTLHLAPLQQAYERLTWNPAAPRADRIRIREHTCSHHAVSYEFCLGGGLAFIRRTYRSDGVAVHESEWLRIRDAERLWLRLLLGQAR